MNVRDLRNLQPGDVIFISVPTAFWAALASEWSLPKYRHGHVGIVSATGSGQIAIVHASGNPSRADAIVVSMSLRDFAMDAARIDVLRPVSKSAAEVAAFTADEFSREHLPFDTDFSLSTPRRLYCSELVWRALSAGFRRDILPHKSRVAGREAILLSDLESSRYLRLVQTVIATENRPQSMEIARKLGHRSRLAHSEKHELGLTKRKGGL